MGIIQKQSIQSSLIIFIGFAIGGFNMIVLAPKLLTPEQLGLTRIVTDAAATVASLATIGCLPVIYKFFPFYKSYLPKQKQDLAGLTFLICLIGFAIMATAAWFVQPLIVRKFSERSPLFVNFSYTVIPFAFFFLLFMWLEAFAWSNKRGVVSNSLKETVFRIFFTIIILVLGAQLIGFTSFMNLFALSWMLPALLLAVILIRHRELVFHFKISSLTRRLKGKMMAFGLFIFGASFLNLLARTADTFILSAKASGGLKDAAIFTIATYVVTLMDVPQRSMNSITIPVLAESWKNKDFNNIRHVYAKSVNNLQLIGMLMFALMLLNVGSLSDFLGNSYSEIQIITLYMGFGKLIDLSTGANAQIIGTSHYWKVDFFTNVVYTLIALPLNYILISNFGLMGAAYANLLAISLYNFMRFGFLWYKFGLQPYGVKNLLGLMLAAAAAFLSYLLPKFDSIYIDVLIRSALFLLLFLPTMYKLRLAPELNAIADKFLRRI